MAVRTVVLVLAALAQANALLFPRDSETRETKYLDGVWAFRISPKDKPDQGFEDKWFAKPFSQTPNSAVDVVPMPVPSSYNDIGQNRTIRDFVGWAWYERSFFVPTRWHDDDVTVMLRFGSVHYSAVVWINGKEVVRHSGGSLPFEADVGTKLNFRVPNQIVVAVNNTLTPDTIPQGEWQYKQESSQYPKGYFTLDYQFDFLNYAGIHRPVLLYTVPRKAHVKDVTVTTDVSPSLEKASVQVAVQVDGEAPWGAARFSCSVELIDEETRKVAEAQSCANASLSVSKPNLWWPYLMKADNSRAYLYRLVVKIISSNGAVLDVYSLNVGIRSVSWNSSGFWINHRPFYFRGFGRHEDADVRGKGLDLALVTKDFNLMQWCGANSFRTSHYPYAEEILDFADLYGIVVIAESAGVALDSFHQTLLDNHVRHMKDLIDRDKNHASVVVWSLANEPRSTKEAARGYFSALADKVRQMDATRPLMVVVNADVERDLASAAVDIVGINRYFGWYSDTGHVELIKRQVVGDLKQWHEKQKKNIIVTEYGADTVAGLHEDPSYIFTEEYQVELMRQNFEAFDVARQNGYIVGEMIWNFADFMTSQKSNRVDGNRKGIFTRSRKPKMGAHALRRRYWELSKKNATHLLTCTI